MINSIKTIPLGVFFTGISGLAVFILLGLGALAEPQAVILFKLYSCLILSFLSGVQWMILAHYGQTQLWKQVLVILPVCILMILFVLNNLLGFLLGAFLLYLSLLIFDLRYFSKLVSMVWYLPLRVILTGGVMALKIALIVYLFINGGV